MPRKLISPLTIIIAFLISLFFVLNTPSLSDGTAIITRDDFVLSFLGLFASLAIAVITFLYSNVERIRESIIKIKSIKDINAVENQVMAIFKELQHNTEFILFALIGCFLLILLRDLDLTFISISFKGISKLQFITTLELSFVILTFVALKDIVGSLFKLVKISSLIIRNSEGKNNG